MLPGFRSKTTGILVAFAGSHAAKGCLLTASTKKEQPAPGAGCYTIKT